MNLSETTRRSGKPLAIAVLVLLVIGAAAGIYFYGARFETTPPRITLAPDGAFIGTAPLEITVGDVGAGLKSVSVTLTVSGAQTTLAAERYAPAVKEKKISVALAKLPGVKEGPATLRVMARDASLWSFFRGNEAVVQKDVTIDITPP